ncbi:MAG: adenylosuccinate synthase [Clostridia bacterium]|nr:adenylosuccinate synthase [Clostridia bacterium]
MNDFEYGLEAKRSVDTCAIVGVNWGDEGKGRMVDLVAEDYDVVVRYQGGNNAGHTIKNDCGTFALNLLPSGIFRHEKMNVLGSGMVVDIRHLCGEIDKLRAAGVRIDPENLMISDRAIIVMPYHVALDGLEEARLSDKPYGSTKRGIAPVYGDKYMKKGLMMGELFDRDYLLEHLHDVLEFKNLQITGVYGAEPFAFEDMVRYLDTYGEILKPYIGDTGAYLRKAAREGRRILYEAQLGALRDIEYGIYPYTSSSSPLAAYAPLGSGTPDIPVNRIIGIVKAYSSCVGEGPFTCEWFGKQAEELREAGGEYGAATGRPRRVGPIDIVATRYGVHCQGATEIALTKLDVLSYMKEIPICIEYDVDGERTGEFPFPSKLERAKPVEIVMPGWGVDISGIRRYEELPEAARNYIEFIEAQLGTRISYVSVGAEREAIILR